MSETIMQIILAAISGAGIGFTLGLVGGGGSILATPLLLYFVGVKNPHIAIGTSAFAVSINAFANFLGHAKKGNVWWRCAFAFASIGTVGALIGSSYGKAIDGQSLIFLFGLVMVLVGVLMFRPRGNFFGEKAGVNFQMCAKTGATALATGFASGFFGIGGGFLIVPALIFSTRMPTINAVGSSLLAVGAFGLATALNYAAADLVEWKLAFAMIAGGVLGGLIGSGVAMKLSSKKDVLGRIFALLIFIVAAYVLYKSGNEIFSKNF